MKSTVQFDMTLTLVDTETECVEVAVNVTANFCAGSPMVRYYPDGSGDPGSDDEVEVTKVVRRDNGEELEWDSLPSACQEALDEAVLKHVADGDDDGPEPDDEEPERFAERMEYLADTAADR